MYAPYVYKTIMSMDTSAFALDDNIIFFSSNTIGLIGNHTTHFFLSSEIGAAPIPGEKICIVIVKCERTLKLNWWAK